MLVLRHIHSQLVSFAVFDLSVMPAGGSIEPSEHTTPRAGRAGDRPSPAYGGNDRR